MNLPPYEFNVLQPHTCDKCDGTGVMQHPDWTEYYCELEKAGIQSGDAKEYNFAIMFWRKKGYSNVNASNVFSGGAALRKVDCDKCAGLGHYSITQRIELTESQVLELIGNYYLQKSRR